MEKKGGIPEPTDVVLMLRVDIFSNSVLGIRVDQALL